MNTLAVILEAPERLALRSLEMKPVEAGDVVVEIAWSGISTGTEKLLWTGKMPPFPGLGYPLVPGYESVGRIVDAGPEARERIGDWVFVPGANCYQDARGLFGGTARRVIVPSARAIPIPEHLGEAGVLCALAATALHAINGGGYDGNPDNRCALPDLVIGHGVLGRLIARLAIALGAPPPTVWETNAARREGATGYMVMAPDEDERRDYRAIYDASGDSNIIDSLVMRMAKGGEIVLAGFYSDRLNFSFPPAFLKEATLRVAAEWQPVDLAETRALIEDGRLDLAGLVTNRRPAAEATEAYPQAFSDPDCLKMVLDWSDC
ncbi:chlorophyll synthesis pathway protein BchC [Erythrobacter dokdonensis]|uniref:2-desacetyl-2-hydroxyethyl bacteriochlorophyllide a dehydrogenase n=1 Tax=Erythrobacter dokdonensis DSW-74 TaxID=1300349 RepID=A0A1A7BD69_9SPHN|nr:chlorophyll synthesis pathway protein BchC [Erythrobacter dokdonensis]OBV10439.1 2-desacetyl-2-hydroxyethyl bacteriochlorophyllide a dehydrogenase [Erythrobacter dokdonensis DSW-74]